MAKYPDPTHFELVHPFSTSSSTLPSLPALAQAPGILPNPATLAQAPVGPAAPPSPTPDHLIDPILRHMPPPTLPAAPANPPPPSTHQPGHALTLGLAPTVSAPVVPVAPPTVPAAATGQPGLAALVDYDGPRHHLYQLINRGLVRVGDVLKPLCAASFDVEATITAVRSGRDVRNRPINGFANYVITTRQHGVVLQAGHQANGIQANGIQANGIQANGIQANGIQGPETLKAVIDGIAPGAFAASDYKKIELVRGGVSLGTLHDRRPLM